MPFADSNRVGIKILEEATWGTTPASGSTRELRLTSSSLAANKETVVSDEIRADRMVSAITEVAASSGGDINFEFSAGAHDELLAAFLMGAWSRPMELDFYKGVQVDITAVNTVIIRGRDVSTASGYLVVGRRIKLDGFNDANNNGYFEISTAVFATDTTVVLTTSTLVIENGNFNSRFYDANDVIVLNDTTIRAGTVAGEIDSAGNNAFTSAIAAGQLIVGQKISLVGLGHQVGDILVTATMDGTDSISFDDGVNPVITLLASNDWTTGVSASADATALAVAINAASPLDIFCDDDAGGQLTLKNLNAAQGELIEISDTGSAYVVTDFSVGTPTARGIFTLESVSDDVLAVSPSPGVDANTEAYKVSIKGSSLKNPSDVSTIAQRSFSIETAFNDVSQFLANDGMIPGTYSLEIASGAIVTGTIGFQGRSSAMNAAAVIGTAPYLQLATHPGEVVNATADIGNVVKDGVLSVACIQSISLSGEANLRQQNCIGSKFSSGVGAGRFNLTGSMTVFFETAELFNNFIDHDTISLGWTITDKEGVEYHYNIPAMKLSADAIAPGGIDQDVFETIEFTSLRDTVTDAMLIVDRFSSNVAVGG